MNRERTRWLLTAALVLCFSIGPSSARSQTGDPKFTLLYTFPVSDPAFPIGPLAQAEDGHLYGVTLAGGAYQKGRVFRVTRTGLYSTLFSFGALTGPFVLDGHTPSAGLIAGADGMLFGSTTQQGWLGSPMVGGSGSLFRISTAGTLQTIATFNGANGAQPFAPLYRGADGLLFGTTNSGGTGSGTAFRVSASGTLTLLHQFPSDASEGANITAGLVEGPDGWLYGTTTFGGVGAYPGAGGGTLYAVKRDGSFRLLHVFDYGTHPTGGLAFGPDGALYGVFDSPRGTAYRISTDGGGYTEIHTFACSCGLPEGSYPAGALVLARDGSFFGVTSGGGLSNKGTIYRMTPAGAVTTLHTFTGADGEGPNDGLIEGSDGRLYGVTRGGYVATSGSVFKLTPLPPTPTGVTATPGTNQVTLKWTPDRLSDTYDVYRGSSAASFETTPLLSGLTDATATVTGLTGDVRYYFSIVAKNEAGASALSAPVNAVAAPPPASGGTGTAGTAGSGGGGGGGGALDLATLALLIATLTVGISSRFSRRPLRQPFV